MTEANAGVATALYTIDTSPARQSEVELRAIFARIKADAQQATAPVGAPASSGGSTSTQSNSVLQLQRAQAALELTQARLARTQGDGAQAAELEARAQARLQSVLDQQNQTTTQTIGVARQLAAAQQQSERAAQQSAAATQQIIDRAGQQGADALQPIRQSARESTDQVGQLGDAFKSGLLGVVGPAAVAGLAIGALKGTVDSFAESLKFKAEIDQNTASITAQLRGLRDSNQVFDDARKFADRYKLTQEDTTTAIQASVPLLRQSKASLTDVLTVLAQLQVLKPEQGIQGAAFALAELQGGQSRSLATRFNIPIEKATELKNEIAKGGDAVQILGDYLTKAGIGSEALEARTKGVAGALNDAALAQERLKIAQGNIAASAGGIFVIEGLSRQYQGLANLLNGDAGEAIQSSGAELRDSSLGALAYATALAEGKSKLDAFAAAQAAVNALQPKNNGGGGSFTFAEDTTAQDAAAAAAIRVGGAFDDERRAAAQLQLQTGQAASDIRRSAEASSVDAAQKELQTTQTKLLGDQNRVTTDSFLALNPNMDASGAIAAAAAQGYPPIIGQLAALRIELQGATADQIAFNNAENAKSTNKAVATERFFGGQGSRGDSSDTASDTAANVTAIKNQTTQTERQIDSQIALAAAHKDVAKQIDLLRQKEGLLGKDQVDRTNIEAQIFSLQQSASKTRVSAAQSTALQLNNVEENSGLQLLKTLRENNERLADAQEDFTLRRARSQQDEDLKIQSLLAHGQRAQAEEERKKFALDQQRNQEDFNIQRTRTLRNNAESTGDIDTRTDLRQQQIGQRAALRGVRPAGGGGGAGLPGTPAFIPDAPVRPTQPRVIQIVINGRVDLDGKTVGQLIYEAGLREQIDEDVALALGAVPPPGGGQTAVAGGRP